jgi:hypothetical protein
MVVLLDAIVIIIKTRSYFIVADHVYYAEKKSIVEGRACLLPVTITQDNYS